MAEVIDTEHQKSGTLSSAMANRRFKLTNAPMAVVLTAWNFDKSSLYTLAVWLCSL